MDFKTKTCIILYGFQCHSEICLIKYTVIYNQSQGSNGKNSTQSILSTHKGTTKLLYTYCGATCFKEEMQVHHKLYASYCS